MATLEQRITAQIERLRAQGQQVEAVFVNNMDALELPPVVDGARIFIYAAMMAEPQHVQ